jgi:predicted lipoprotein with Yx(FWY)xxD motif
MYSRYIGVAVIAIFLAGSLGSCSKDYNSSGSTSTTPANSFQLKTDSRFGTIITDGNGVSLYFFVPDANGIPSCTGACSTSWPTAYIPSPVVGDGLLASDFSSTKRPDGSMQSTYKGWPLYKFAGDVSSGGGAYGGPVTNTVSGDGIEGIWFVAKPDYTVMLAETQLVGNDGVSYDSLYVAATGNTFYITDDHGVTLYSFSHDKSGQNTFTLSDFSNDSFFPIVQLPAIQSVPSALNKSDFALITVFGKTQLTYKGWPVYRFGQDGNQRGSTKGISVPTPGIWPVMNQHSASAPQ